MQRIKLYCLASKYCVTPLMERLIDGIHNSIAEHCEFLDLAEINYAYKNCNGACGLTAFISKFVASCKFGRNSHISKETRYKLLREHKGLCLAGCLRAHKSLQLMCHTESGGNTRGGVELRISRALA
jgi:hypothetical protein